MDKHLKCRSQKCRLFVVCLNVLEASLISSIYPDKTVAPIGAVWSGWALFLSLLKLVNNVSKYTQQTTNDAFNFKG